jgi:hypothetical protein
MPNVASQKSKRTRQPRDVLPSAGLTDPVTHISSSVKMDKVFDYNEKMQA